MHCCIAPAYIYMYVYPLLLLPTTTIYILARARHIHHPRITIIPLYTRRTSRARQLTAIRSLALLRSQWRSTPNWMTGRASKALGLLLPTRWLELSTVCWSVNGWMVETERERETHTTTTRPPPPEENATWDAIHPFIHPFAQYFTRSGQLTGCLAGW